ncbi:hypothetical protein COL5a_009082 [Colletotrichum fioriniae]|uniref:uncharacterized protein n=1 Tax=Colletotrichum fioriniae TaxID=710243 RepID=UPI0022FFDF11|nr:uncharacterized protein COL516b_012207 [Colletotrichum fioriniae]KAJ0295789.1 hypothetical protein COL516b_012207 [Colletotrichum fioriniae]KAJ0321898.1 hypothetical protein COL5a_009082 [Colletotrichum fioriniae]KAJ3944972.1 hypothetical protein N0V96_004991 [Colletotrichum fioriniae]
MRAFTVAAALLVAGAQAAPALESRQIIYGCYFSGDGIVNQYVSVGHDIDVTGTSGKSYHIDCGTTSGQIVPDVFAKCTVDGKKPDGITANESDKK